MMRTKKRCGAELVNRWLYALSADKPNKENILMSKSQRTKGADGEREVCRLIREALGVKAVRNLNQTREGGADIKLKPYSIEVKRRARIGLIYDWMAQARKECLGEERPLVVCRADGKEWLAVMPIEELFRLIREELDPYPWEVEQ